jgi:hypothetical protein
MDVVSEASSVSPKVSALERKLQMVRWQKEQNRMQMQKTLGLTKQMQEMDAVAQMVGDPRAASLARTERIVQEVLAQPIEISDAEIARMETSDRLETVRRDQRKRAMKDATKKVAERAAAHERIVTYKEQRSVLLREPTKDEVEGWEAEFEVEYAEKLAAKAATPKKGGRRSGSGGARKKRSSRGRR